MLSIIIITKDEEKYLPKLLKSIEKQDYDGPYELIVADANSKDKTKQIAKKFGCKIVKGGVPSVGRNMGAKVAKGDIYLFLDADVVLPKDYLRKNLAEFTYRNLMAATTVYVPLSDSIIDMMLYKSYDIWAKAIQVFYPHAGGFCIFCRAETFKKAKGFDPKIVMAEDHAFVNECSKFGKFRIMKSSPIFCAVRRLDKEGRWKIAAKYMYSGAYRVFFGEIYKPLYDYEMQGFNFKEQKNK